MLFLLFLFPLLSHGEFCKITYNDEVDQGKIVEFKATECLTACKFEEHQIPLTAKFLNELRNPDFEWLKVECSNSKECCVTADAYNKEINSQKEQEKEVVQKTEDLIQNTEEVVEQTDLQKNIGSTGSSGCPRGFT